MRCSACDELLTDYDASVRSIFSRTYVDLCKHCLGTIKTDIVAVGNPKLMSDADECNEAAVEPIDGLIEDYPEDDYFSDMWNDR